MKKKKIKNITQEIEFGRKVESVAIWHKSVVPLILWFDIINGQFVDPKRVKKLTVYIMVLWDTRNIFNTCVRVSSPANMCDIYSGIWLDFYTVLVPGSSHVLIGHLTLENCLILRLHCEVCNALVNLQSFLCTVRKTQGHRLTVSQTTEAFRLQRRCYFVRQQNTMRKDDDGDV